MRFREHRGGLAESLATVVDLPDRAALDAHVRAVLSQWRPPPDRIEVLPYGGDDDRCGWKNVHMVMVDGWGPVGFVEIAEPDPKTRP